ncbi:MAG TPA: hypothetical protein ENK05_08430 [Gammaproteobacteria bacterium]|nr:hypothetical protein [Gammaproteobacteria bacterium]
MNRAARILVGGWLIVSGFAASATAAPNVQFSAETVQAAPGKEEHHARIYVGDNQVRLEYTRDKVPRVEIYDMKHQRALLLMPQQKLYMERKVPVGQNTNPMLPPSDSNPCARAPGAKCRQLGRETLYGRPVLKWEMTMSHDGKELRSLQWIDAERHTPIRQEWPDGTVTDLQPLGQETLNGRRVERWLSITKRPDGKTLKSTQWYDPQLQIAIREELPGGYVRELRNIQVGPQPESLFQVPAGYRLTTAREQMQNQSGGATGQGAPRQQRTAPYPARR